jgi:hypothetical protein
MGDAGHMTVHPFGQGKDAIRRANLSAMLGTLVRDGAQSLSELTQRLRLSRTAVAELATQLGGLGLVDERDSRPSNHSASGTW